MLVKYQSDWKIQTKKVIIELLVKINIYLPVAGRHFHFNKLISHSRSYPH